MNNSIKIFITLTVLFFSLPGIIRAGEIDLDKIVVTPSRMSESYGDTARKVDVITAKDIENSSAEDCADLFTGLTSTNISEFGGLGAAKNIRMRGSSSAQVLVMLDGMPINSPRDGAVDLSTIPLDNIQRIEVLHGPASSLYGSQAMGGTVNIITKGPPKEGQKSEITSSFGNFHTYIDRLSYGAKIKNLGFLVNGGYQSSVGFRDNSELNAKDFNAKFEYAINAQNNLIINSGFFKNKTGAPGPLTDSDVDNKQSDLKNFLDFAWTSAFLDDSLHLKTRVYDNYDRLEFMPNRLDSPGEIGGWDALSKATHTTKVNGIDVEVNKQFSDFGSILGGINYVRNYNDSTTSAKHKYTVRAGYLESQLEFLKKWKMSLGVRADDYSNFGLQASPSFSLLYKINDANNLHTSINRSFRAPTFNDLYWPNEGGTKGNPNLKPEKGTTYEIGYEGKLNKYLSSGVTYYKSIYNELINWAPDPTFVWTPTNIGSAQIQGVELENKIYFLDNFELDLGYTFLDAKDKKTHKFLNYQPENKVDASLKYNGPKGLLLELKGQFTGQRFDDAANNTKVKQFFVFGFNLTKKFKHGFTYYLSMNNMLARKYQVNFGYPMPRFSIDNSLKWEF